MNNKKILAALLAALMLLVNLSPMSAKAASADSPFCRISYDSNVGCDTVKYYFYVDGTAKYDASRLVKFYDGKILLGINNTTVTSTHKAGTHPVWTPDGSYLIWIEADLSLWSRAYADGINKKIADSVSSLGLNAESMVETVTFSDNRSSSINELLNTPTNSVVSDSAIAVATATPSASTPNQTAAPTKAPYKKNKCKNYLNKSVFYAKGTTNKYVLKRTGNKLYINGKLVVSGISKNAKDIFGFSKSFYVYFVKNHKLYWASKFDPTKHQLLMQNVRSLNFDKKTGFVTTVNRLKKKVDYVETKKSKAILYQNGKIAHVLKTNKTAKKLYLDGKLVDTSKTKKFNNLGFTEDGSFCYCKGKIPHKAKIELPSAKEKWKTTNTWTKNYLGFSSIK